MIKEIVFASSNPGKIKEVTEIFAPLDIKIRPQTDFNVPDIEETGLTFIENAILKARNCCAHTGLPALADDSGLEVDILGGAPGIYSARYGGDHRNGEKNINKLLNELKDIPQEKRSARFQCWMILMKHDKDPVPQIFNGAWEGFILNAKQGDHGFGYDPVFYVPEEDCSAAELTADIKNKLSHRGKALAKMKVFLQK
tara:strand:- start:536 stop:1129 length:594 start_codon:yes stop_codon:yes gene_type:complete